MRALIIKDLLIIYKEMGKALIFPIVCAFISPFFAVIGILVATLLPMATISFDKKCGFDKLEKVYPFTVVELVFSKYVMGYICISVVGVFIFVARMFFSPSDAIETVVICLLAGGVALAVNLPIIFRFGMEKGRIVHMIVIVGLSIGSEVFDSLNLNILYDFESHSISVSMLFVGVVLLNILSIFVSRKIKAKEQANR